MQEQPPWEVVAGGLRAACSPVCPWGRVLGIPMDRWTGPHPHRFQADPSKPQSRSTAEHITSSAVLGFFSDVLSFKCLLTQSP